MKDADYGAAVLRQQAVIFEVAVETLAGRSVRDCLHEILPSDETPLPGFADPTKRLVAITTRPDGTETHLK
jgi:hypothetical protein